MQNLSKVLDEIISNKTPGYIKGQLVDHYTASLIKTVYDKLHENNKKVFLSKTVDEMVALAYKLVTG